MGQLESTKGARHVQPKEASFRQRGHDRLGESPIALSFIGMLPNQGFKRANGAQEPFRYFSCCHNAVPPPKIVLAA